MKTKFICFVITIVTIMGCNKNNNDSPMEVVQQNEPPLSFALIDVADGATEVHVTPTLSWGSAENSKGTAVTYTLYLGTDNNPSTIYESGITSTSFELNERLLLLTDYSWKVVATDTNGKTSQSPIHKFTTRYYIIPDEPLLPIGFFSPRFSHASTVFDNRIWMTGGYDGEVRGDVRATSNGSLSTIYTHGGAFQKRYFHEMLNYDEKLWVIGGRNLVSLISNVWYSEDGKDWTQAIANAAFNGRYSFGATVFDNKMWVIGGQGGGLKNDVWYSSDGAIWTPATLSSDFSKRAGHAVVTFNNKIWVIGGSSNGERKNDVWFSSDGINWTEATAEAPFLARSGHTATVFDHKIWVVGGYADGENLSFKELNDVWYSSDGVQWESITVSDSFPKRGQHTTVAFNDQLWIMGGIGINSYNDIWVTD